MLGNYSKWKVHAKGLKEMVRTRGGMSSVAPGLQMKICRYNPLCEMATGFAAQN